jgi:hypothetical protein
MTSIDGDQTPQEAASAPPEPNDAFLWGYPLFALCCEIILATLTYLERTGGSSLILAFLLFIPIALVMIVLALVGVFSLVRGRFKRAAALLLAPFILFSPFIFPIGPLEYMTLDSMRFYLNKGKYAEVIDKLPPVERASKVVFFYWGVTGFLSATTDYWLVYDESGEIALPDEERSQAWKDRVYPEQHLVDDHCVTSAYRLSGHYYSFAMSCSY